MILLNIDVVRLNNNIIKSVLIDELYSFTKEELNGTDLLNLDNVKIKGELFKNSFGNLELNVDVSGIMVIPCAITLKPVDYPFDINISGEINELMCDFEKNEINFQNTIDILPIIWENILMEIPLRVVSEEAKNSNISMSGDGWKFIAGEEEINNPFSELMDMIDDSEVK